MSAHGCFSRSVEVLRVYDWGFEKDSISKGGNKFT